MHERFPVISGAESFYIEGNETGILISHGFLGTPQSVRFLGETLANYGYTVSAPRLNGHGTSYLDIEKCTEEDWFASLENAYVDLTRRCKTIFVMGQSMGGALTLWLASKYREIDGIILINTALSLPSYDYLRNAASPRYLGEGEPDIKAESVFEITYDKVPLKAIHQLQNIMDKTPAVLPKVDCPVLAIKSAVDNVVPPKNTDYIMGNIKSTEKKMIVLQNSYHVASMDNDKEQIAKESHMFMQQRIARTLEI
ncbi:alpha/beta fold hydrolase [Bacillus sp. FJAT-27251]|uniref:alpha/beta hydrolase n=1 Tax=Bacillus sp. FJAT-27251 TaxID=1684142 RepID=UPI0006A7F159|nr:alpha/beta fold hydrolase [Bacillus sp. FJAT-27251]